MDRRVVTKYLLFIGLFSLVFSGCGSKKKGTGQMVFDDTVKLSEALTTQYDINKLDDYFANGKMNELPILGENKILTFADVDKTFPIQLTRSSLYSVFKIEEEGYYFVFWTKDQDDVQKDVVRETDYCVFFAASVEKNDGKMFSSLEPGIDTAEDVKLIDPSVEMVFFLSRGIFSYSYLNKDELIEIEYCSIDGEFNKLSDLVIKDIKVVNRSKTVSCYSLIMDEDLPD